MDAPKALITGGSRGVGAATAVALAECGFDIGITYREKTKRAREVAADVESLGRNVMLFSGDMTEPEARTRLIDDVGEWTGNRLQALVLNASGGLEKNRDAGYAMQINRDSQIALVEGLDPVLGQGSSVAFITSHWAHRYGAVEQLPHYEPVAESKYLGELEMRAKQAEWAARGVRLLVITGDLVEDTATAELLEWKEPGLVDARRTAVGELINSEDMGGAIAGAIINPQLRTGTTVVVGAPLESLG